jgi:hypothetical protein
VSLPLRDLGRFRITIEADLALEAEHRASGRDKSEIARDVLHAWSLRKIEEAKVLSKLLNVEGLSRESQG